MPEEQTRDHRDMQEPELGGLDEGSGGRVPTAPSPAEPRRGSVPLCRGRLSLTATAWHTPSPSLFCAGKRGPSRVDQEFNVIQQ